MNTNGRWIDLEGAVNVRDLGGLAITGGGVTRFGRVLRGDNLQGLTGDDTRRLVGALGLRHVVDLRSHAEVRLEGPGPLTGRSEVSTHHLSLFAEGGHHTDVEADLYAPSDAGADAGKDGDGDRSRGGSTGETASGRRRPGVPADIERALAVGSAADPAADPADLVLPWQARQERLGAQRSLDFYLGYLRDRPDSIVAALRVMAHNDGTALVHCAAGKDRTGVVVAFALAIAGVERQAIVDDYVQTGDRLEPLLARLRASTTYAADLDSRPAESHRPHAATMEGFLGIMDDDHGGPLGWLTGHGWTDADTAALRGKLAGG